MDQPITLVHLTLQAICTLMETFTSTAMRTLVATTLEEMITKEEAPLTATSTILTRCAIPSICKQFSEAGSQTNLRTNAIPVISSNGFSVSQVINVSQPRIGWSIILSAKALTSSSLVTKSNSRGHG